jgi:hypothetical protein
VPGFFDYTRKHPGTFILENPLVGMAWHLLLQHLLLQVATASLPPLPATCHHPTIPPHMLLRTTAPYAPTMALVKHLHCMYGTRAAAVNAANNQAEPATTNSPAATPPQPFEAVHAF